MVLHVTRDLPPRVRGGLSVAVGGLVAAAAGSAEQAVLSFDGWRPRAGAQTSPAQRSRTNEGAPVLRVASPDHLAEAAAFSREVDPDLVIVHHGMLFDPSAQFAADRPRALFVHVLQEALSAARGLTTATLSATAQRHALEAADVIYVPSESAQAALERPCTVLPLGLARRTATSLPRDPDLVLGVGRYDAAKGTGDLLAAVPAVLRRRPSARFILAGGLPDSPKSERRWIRRWTERASATELAAVEFTGWLPPEEIERLQRTAAAVVAPSRIETFGLAVLEAQHAGAAVVASDIPAHRELITPNTTGLLVPPGDVGRLAGAVSDLLADPERRSRLGRDGAGAAGRALWALRVGAHLDAWRAIIGRGR